MHGAPFMCWPRGYLRPEWERRLLRLKRSDGRYIQPREQRALPGDGERLPARHVRNHGGSFQEVLGSVCAARSGKRKKPNNPSDSGWDAAWNTGSLEATATALTTAVKCDATYQTYTAGNDALPMSCLDWFEAEAFCVWDGGRLPTQAESNYAAAGVMEQRVSVGQRGS
jgi:hypothetical protein